MHPPAFWWREESGAAARLLAPAAAVYGGIAGRRMARQGVDAGVPVVCLGNPTVGGGGKTPAALAVARRLAARGWAPVFLTRGYGGRLRGPTVVDLEKHRAADVGDEPLLLARTAKTVVAHDRVAGARTALACGADVIVMDDGFQNPSLRKDLSILLLDSRRMLGNARVFPAGPLRAPLAAQLARAHAIVIVGEHDRDLRLPHHAGAQALPVLHATLLADAASLRELAGRHVVAFAGIADPGKFFATLTRAGLSIAARQAFPDHHPYTPGEIAALLADADQRGGIALTTEKDMARLRTDPALGEFASRIAAMPVRLVPDDEVALTALLVRAVEGKRRAAGAT
jgi:tetraacyldisaccharide 4'-kinase